MDVSFQTKDGVGVVSLTGALTTSQRVDLFQEQFVAWWQSKPDIRYVVVNFASVEFLDSSGLGSLFVMLKYVAERGGDMKIACLQKKPRMIFEITRLYKVFDIFDSESAAIKRCISEI